MSIKLAVALKNYFGTKEGQSLSDFVGEMKMLTPEDKAELAKLLTEELGEEVVVAQS